MLWSPAVRYFLSIKESTERRREDKSMSRDGAKQTQYAFTTHDNG